MAGPETCVTIGGLAAFEFDEEAVAPAAEEAKTVPVAGDCPAADGEAIVVEPAFVWPVATAFPQLDQVEKKWPSSAMI
jgi:hypothetical protein